MAYDDDKYGVEQTIMIPIEIDTPEGSAGDDVYKYTMPFAGVLTGAEAYVTEVFASDNTAAVISVLVSTTSKITITPADAAAVGSVVQGVVASAAVDAGDVLIIDKTTLPVDAGTETGKVYVSVRFREAFAA